ncbi:MAG TPA: hypothetical protein PJ994_05575 [Tepidiformaceae bacterium]|nr:hypothetical protein [Tepidiformaceae bacterium]HMO97141.1 hypothetical protein [Tepidiformaceae bacterium]
MATLETVYHDFLSLSPEERQLFRDLLPEDDLDEEYWARLRPELDRRFAESEKPGTRMITAEESIRNIRERIRAHED